jgi:hypothetical protein
MGGHLCRHFTSHGSAAVSGIRVPEWKAMIRIALVAGIACTAMVFAPRAGAYLQGLGPFVGQWGGAYRYGLTISPDGSGRYSGPDFTKCPACSMSDVPARGHY